MRCYSTNNREIRVSIGEAILQGLAPDGGLYMPEYIPQIAPEFVLNLASYSFADIAIEISRHYLGDEIPDPILTELIQDAINFNAPVVPIHSDLGILELFHGPTLAFKDFGARFMSRVMSYLNRSERELLILVATSGDTGGAVASGFFNVPGTQVVILYPQGGVSFLQEKQLTTLGGNITAIELQGSFDDCQALAKQAFTDDDLQDKLNLSSANSINLARLIPQSFYYFEAYKQIADPSSKEVVFIVPSGNFGNLTAGVLAKQMGLPVHHFVAATNVNDIVPNYLETARYEPRPSVSTLSNAMDVGNPSNFSRLLELYGSTWNLMQEDIKGYRFNDDQTLETIRHVYRATGYVLDPHTAVGYLAYQKSAKSDNNQYNVLLSTAHPSKFIDSVEKAIGKSIDIPDRLNKLAHLAKRSTVLKNEYEDLKSFLLQRFS